VTGGTGKFPMAGEPEEDEGEDGGFASEQDWADEQGGDDHPCFPSGPEFVEERFTDPARAGEQQENQRGNAQNDADE